MYQLGTFTQFWSSILVDNGLENHLSAEKNFLSIYLLLVSMRNVLKVSE